MTKEISTDFASPERGDFNNILKENKELKENYIISALLDSSPDMVIILNKYRQTLLANDNMIRFLKMDNEESLLGKRPGEVLNWR